MLLHLLLHVLIFHLLTAKGGQKDATKASVQQALREQKTTANSNEKQNSITPKDMNYVMKYIEKCPEKGYYFARDYSPNRIEPDACYLCFCQGGNSAVCWKRDNMRCNDESFRYHSVDSRDAKTSPKKGKDTRIRRSPGFTDIFFRDASRDVFNKNSEDRQCKPYESSFSDDCPPADWCTGCTVCDCDANGRWDCHILSFCNDPKKNKNNGRKVVKKKRVKDDIPIGARPRTSMPIMSRRVSKKNHESKKKVVKKSVTQPRKSKQKQQKVKPPLRYKRIAQKPKASKTMFKKRNVATHKRVHLNKKKEKVDNFNGLPDDVAKQIVKQMMSIVNKLVQKQIHNMTKLVAKRQQWFQEQQDKQLEQAKHYMTTLTPRIIGGTRKTRRYKREVQTDINKGTSKSKLRPKRYKRDLTSTVADTDHFTASYSTIATQKEKLVVSTMTPRGSDVKDISVGPNTKSITIIPLPTNTDREDDYYKYVVATNIIPLLRNKTSNDELLKSTTVFKTNIINTTDRITVDRIETNTVDIEEGTTEKENIIIEKTENTNLFTMKTTDLPVTITTKNDSVNMLNNNTNVNVMDNTSADGIVLNYVSNPNKSSAEVNPAENDIKFNKWPLVKIVKEKESTTESVTEDQQNHIDIKTIQTENNKYKVRRKDVKRIKVSRKYNLLKALNYYRCPFLNKVTLNDNEKYMIGANKNIPGVKNALTKLLTEYNSTIKLPKKMKSFSIMKYLRKLFNYVFKRKSRSEHFSRYHILETLCEHFGPCRIKSRDRYILRSKLTDLNHETMAILKTVKIIKGLLILLDDSTVKNKSSSEKRNLGSAIQKLNSILKGNYFDNSKESLTETKVIQIEYIKKNTQNFVKSVGKFATLLNEIIAIITKEGKSNKINVNKQQMGTAQQDPFMSLKNLLIKYNLVQNNFMKKMYDLVNSFENKTYVKPKVSETRDLNSSVAIENFSRNILKNLRKLKHLSQTLNYNGRTKRDIRDDDAIDYLLMLMEYLLKQNHPLDVAPVNDGIDLLLEAIKNAPDIKTVRKKVLVNTPSGTDTTLMSISRNILYRSTTDTSLGDAESDSETTSNEDSDKSKVNNNLEALKTKIEETKDLFDIADEEKDIVDKMQFDRRAGAISSLTDFTTSLPIYDEVDKNTLVNSLIALEITTSPQAFNEEERSDNSTNHGSENENALSDNPGHANNYDNTESVNVFSNTVNNNYDMNTGYGNNDDGNTGEGNVYMGNPGEGNHNAVDNDNYNAIITPKHVDIFNMKASNEISNAVTEESVTERAITEEGIKVAGDKDKKVETVYTGDMDEEETTLGITLGSEIEVTTVIPQEVDNIKNQHISKEIKTLDSYDTEKLDKKSKLEWIEENFRRQYSHHDEEKGKAPEEKIEESKHYVPVTIAPSRTSAPEHTRKKSIIDVSMISNEVSDQVGKKKKIKINTEEVMFKKQMDLLNSLDYVTEKIEFDETESKDGNAEEKYSETFPAYFV